MTPSITLDKAKRNFDNVIEIVDREGEVYITKNKLTYHLHRELTEDEAVKIGDLAQKEYDSGKSRSFETFIKSQHPQHARDLEDNQR